MSNCDDTRKYFPSGGSNFRVWVEQVEEIVTYLPSLYTVKEVQVMSVSRLPHPATFLTSLTMESDKDPNKLSFKLQVVIASVLSIVLGIKIVISDMI